MEVDKKWQKKEENVRSVVENFVVVVANAKENVEAAAAVKIDF